ncbi:MAG: cupin domain-containing protein [Planctomycetes bacterium]|nr:cupin domain-containing protein [Planctomycetota bacterium]
MAQGDRIRVFRLAETRRRIPGPAGEHGIRLLQRGSLDIALSIPVSPKLQAPHAQDELYVIVRGRGVLLHDGNRETVEAGDLVFVAAGADHQLEGLGNDFTLWRVFYGPPGGESPTGETT